MGLQHAFEKGMIHRDIKPHNMILVRDGKKHLVKILDFGLAKATQGQGQFSQYQTAIHRKLTKAGAMMGTPDYMAPEQILDAATADIRADLYSLGCTLYFLLTGRPPFPSNNLEGLLAAHLSEQATPLNEVRPEVPVELAEVVTRLLAKDPAQRYQTPVEVAQVLAPFVKAGLQPLPRGAMPGGGKVSESPRAPAMGLASPGSSTLGEQARAPNAWRAGNQKADHAGNRPETPAPVPVPRPKVGERGPTDTLGKKPKRRARWPEHRGGKGWDWWLWVGGGVNPTAGGRVGLWAGLFRTNTPEGILVLKVNQPNPDVFVDGDRMVIDWKEDGKTAEMHLQPGTRKVEVKKAGFKDFREELDLQEGTRHTLSAKLVVSEGILVLKVNQPNPDVFVDGDQVPVHWEEDGKTAEIRLLPGKRKVEVKKAGFIVIRRGVELHDGKRSVLNAKLVVPEGILVVKVNQSNPDLYVDGDKIPTSWDKDGKTAEIRLLPGKHQVEVKKSGIHSLSRRTDFTARTTPRVDGQARPFRRYPRYQCQPTDPGPNRGRHQTTSYVGEGWQNCRGSPRNWDTQGDCKKGGFHSL